MENRENTQPSRARCGTLGPVGGLCGCLRFLTDDAKPEIIPGHKSASRKFVLPNHSLELVASNGAVLTELNNAPFAPGNCPETLVLYRMSTVPTLGGYLFLLRGASDTAVSRKPLVGRVGRKKHVRTRMTLLAIFLKIYENRHRHFLPKLAPSSLLPE